MELMTSARSALAVIQQVAAQQGGIDFEAASLLEFPLARDLCKRLLEINPNRRIQTAAQAIEHPWYAALQQLQQQKQEQKQQQKRSRLRLC